MSSERDLPVTEAQLSIWTIQQLDPAAVLYRGYNIVTVREPLEPERLQRAVDALIEAHDALRTTFPVVAGRPVQRIHARMDATVVWRRTAASAGDLAGDLLADAERPYDFARGPLFRFIVFVCPDGEQVILFAANHIVADLSSSFLVFEELEDRYVTLGGGASQRLLPPAMPFSAHVERHHAVLAGDKGAALESYWREMLSGSASVLSLPIDRPRPAVEARRGRTVYVDLPAPLVADVQRAAARCGGTLNAALLAGFAVLLHRYSGQASLVVGTYVSGRTSPALKPVIGLLSSLLPLRLELEPGGSFLDLVGQVGRVLRGAYRHQAFPIARMAERFQPARDPSRAPIVQAALNFYSDAPVLLRQPTWDRTRWLALRQRNQEGQFELNVSACLRDDGSVVAALQYQTALFEDETIARMGRSLTTLLADAARDPGRDVGVLRLLTDDERRTVVTRWNDTQRDYPRDQSVHGLIREQIARTPDAIAVCHHDDAVTFREFGRQTAAMAARLREARVTPGAYVAVCLPPSIIQVVALVAILETGAAYLPLDPAHPRERRVAMLEDAAVTLLVGDEKTLSGMSIVPGFSVAEMRPGGPDELPPLDPDAGGLNCAYVVFTSGSTGRPKGIEVSHRSVVNALFGQQDVIGLRPGDVWLSITTLSFDVAALEIFLPLVTGARVVLADRDVAGNGARLAAECERCGATIMQATPTSWRLLLGSGRWPAQSLARISGGEPLPRAVADLLLQRPGPVWNFYGPAETTIYSTMARVEPGDRPPSIGRPLANTQVYVLDAAMAPVPIGVIGDLWIGGDGVALGYAGRPALTAERFVPDPFAGVAGARLYRTGDLARWRASGDLEFLGRIDHQVKIRGIRIELEEIEAALLQQPDVAQAIVVARPDSAGEIRLAAYVVAAGGCGLDRVGLRQRMRDGLPDYMVPASMTVLDAMPLNPNRKVDRAALPAPDAEPLSRVPFVEPRAPLERQLAQLYAAVLDVTSVGIDDDFFDLGGASISTLQLCVRAEAAGLPLAPEAIFEHRTVRALAALLAGRPDLADAAAPPPTDDPVSR